MAAWDRRERDGMSGASRLDAAAATLRAGRVVLVPTDTVYGLAVDPSVPDATAALYRIKARPPDVPIPVLAGDTEQAFALAGDIPDPAGALAARFWPGGLTLVLPRRPGLGYDLGGPDEATIGVRVPDDPLVRALALEVGPLATTSANLHGATTPPTAAEVLAQLGPAASAIGAVLDDGPRRGLPSTVVRIDGGHVVVLREGTVTRVTVERFTIATNSHTSHEGTIHEPGDRPT